MNVEEPETEPAASPSNTDYRNFRVVSEPGVLDEEEKVVSLGGYDYLDPETGEPKTIVPTGAPPETEDGEPVRWINYDLLYVKTVKSGDEEAVSKPAMFTHNLFPPQPTEDGSVSPENYCRPCPVIAKKVEIVFLMDDVGKAEDGYCNGDVYVYLEDGESDSEKEENSSNIVISDNPNTVEELRAKTREIHERRKCELRGRCAVRMHADATNDSVGSLPASYDSMMLPPGVYPVKLSFCDNGSDRAWLPEIDSSKSSVPIANLFIKGWSETRHLVKTRNVSSESSVNESIDEPKNDMEDGFTSRRVKPYYEIPAYSLKKEIYQITKTVTTIKADGSETVIHVPGQSSFRWAEQSGFHRSSDPGKLRDKIALYASNSMVREIMPTEMTDPEWEIPFWTHENGAVVCEYDAESKKNEFWHKLCVLLAASGGVGELHVIQSRPPTAALVKASDEQFARDNPTSVSSPPANPLGVLAGGMNVKPGDSGLDSYIRIEQTGVDDIEVVPGEEVEIPEHLAKEIDNAVDEFNKNVEILSMNENVDAVDLDPDTEWNIDDDVELETVDSFEINYWYDFTDENKPYEVITGGNTQWLRVNYWNVTMHSMNVGTEYGTQSNPTSGYDGSFRPNPSFEPKNLGYLYTVEEAKIIEKEIGKDGWRVPSKEDWEKLFTDYNSKTPPVYEGKPNNNAAQMMKGDSVSWEKSNSENLGESTFRALPAGMVCQYSQNHPIGRPWKLGYYLKERACFVVKDETSVLLAEMMYDKDYVQIREPDENEGDVCNYYSLRFCRGPESFNLQTQPPGSEVPGGSYDLKDMNHAEKQYVNANGWVLVGGEANRLSFDMSATMSSYDRMPQVTSNNPNVDCLDNWVEFVNDRFDPKPNYTHRLDEHWDLVPNWFGANWDTNDRDESKIHFMTVSTSLRNYIVFFKYENSKWMMSKNVVESKKTFQTASNGEKELILELYGYVNMLKGYNDLNEMLPPHNTQRPDCFYGYNEHSGLPDSTSIWPEGSHWTPPISDPEFDSLVPDSKAITDDLLSDETALKSYLETRTRNHPQSHGTTFNEKHDSPSQRLHQVSARCHEDVCNDNYTDYHDKTKMHFILCSKYEYSNKPSDGFVQKGEDVWVKPRFHIIFSWRQVNDTENRVAIEFSDISDNS